jgi:hypothetical protein
MPNHGSSTSQYHNVRSTTTAYKPDRVVSPITCLSLPANKSIVACLAQDSCQLGRVVFSHCQRSTTISKRRRGYSLFCNTPVQRYASVHRPCPRLFGVVIKSSTQSQSCVFRKISAGVAALLYSAIRSGPAIPAAQAYHPLATTMALRLSTNAVKQETVR